MLYTNQQGERRVRIFNIASSVTDSINNYFKAANCEVFVTYLLRSSLASLPSSNAKSVKDSIINQVVELLTKYRKSCSSNSAPSQLVIPESLKIMLIQILGALRSPAFALLNYS